MQQGVQPRIREVWAHNLHEEMRLIRDVIETCPYIAMDTEFPGVIARPIGNFKTMSEYHYQTMRCNVDLLKLVQFGITLADEEGNHSHEGSTWQFNFRFSVNEDMYSPEFIELLQKSGIDLVRHEEMGIAQSDFAELMISSGLVLTNDTKWISFHSGYDFGYFLRALTGESLPSTEEMFWEVLHTWFPTVYDTRYILNRYKPSTSKGLTLNDMAEELGIQRVGNAHQAGPDSLLISDTFFKLREIYSPEGFDHIQFNGKMYGFGQTATATNGLTDPTRGGATIAEREDRTTIREVHTPGPQNQGVNLGLQLQAGIPTQIPPTQYAPMGNGPPYLRTSLVTGR
ncbi:CCR4-NOT core DEDD RNase subunit [Marasmius tenuissimus]|uniref:poly(A)-specific ribonuclease n=1 Tax=Marasmius tenuissimus TaxID=585030 RepID=A0ABR3A7J3_9AGAR|nr:CCR4-NOT core DEDD RNase subunit [Marasmius tenuissimus]